MCFEVLPGGLEPHIEGAAGRLPCQAGPSTRLFSQRTPETHHALWCHLVRPANNKAYKG